MARPIHNLVSFLMIGAVLSGSLLSPAVRHAHADGNLPHSHAADVASRDVHHAHSGGTPHVHKSPDCVKEKLSDRAVHCHVAFLWFDLTLPREGEPSDSQSPFGEDSVVVERVAPEIITKSVTGRTALEHLTWIPSVSAQLGEAAIAPVPQALFHPVDRILLCDSARCERSGVLLI